jgi:hypothetical protein
MCIKSNDSGWGIFLNAFQEQNQAYKRAQHLFLFLFSRRCEQLL